MVLSLNILWLESKLSFQNPSKDTKNEAIELTYPRTVKMIIVDDYDDLGTLYRIGSFLVHFYFSESRLKLSG